MRTPEQKAQRRILDAENKDHINALQRAYRKNNPEKMRAFDAKTKAKHRERVLARKRDYFWRNREIELKRTADWRLQNKENLSDYFKNLYNSNPDYRLKLILRSRVVSALKNKNKRHHSLELIGCSIIQARTHLENQFTDGMTWENHGRWHIDHIIPLSLFDLNDVEQQKEAFHYTNLQPLWAFDNLSKHNKILV